jgi:O-antigen/teichoic acid export membrane protein
MSRKTLRRAGLIVQNSLQSLLQPVFNVAISALVVRLAAPELWGAFVAVLVFVQLGIFFAGWGNQDYLLRAFSRQPNAIPSLWQTSLTSRLPLLIIVCLLLMIFTHPLIIVWAGAAFLAQSYAVMITYRRHFVFALVVEIVWAGIIVGGVISAGSDLTLTHLFGLFTGATALKAIGVTWHFRDLWRGIQFRFDRNFYRDAWPFFLLGLSGILASRIDLYTVSLTQPDDDIGRYQVFMNLMLYLQATAQFILLPFLKGVYRLNETSILRIGRRLFTLGLALVPVALLAAYGLFILVYDIRYAPEFMILGGLFVLPLYGYLPLIHRLYKRDEQNVVLWVNLAGAGGNFALNLLLIPPLGISGALLASAVMQWGMFAYYRWEVQNDHPMPDMPGAERV